MSNRTDKNNKMRVWTLLILVIAIAYIQGKPTDEYIVKEGSGKAYKLVYESKAWTEAKEFCEHEEGKLAVPKTQDEFEFIQKLIHGMHYPDITGTSYKLLAFVGINNLENYKVWKNVDGENIEDTGFHTWSGKNGNGYSDCPDEPHCVGMDAANPGLRDWWCHLPQPYVCEKSV